MAHTLTRLGFVVLLASAATTHIFAASDDNSTVAGGSVFHNGIRTQDEIFVVNVRPLGCSTDSHRIADDLEVQQYQLEDEHGSRHWQRTKMAEMVDGSATTIVYVHGNRITTWDAKKYGLSFYRRLARQSDDDRPIRYVIFSWPSAQIRGPLNDVRTKATRTRPAGWELAWVLDQFPADTQLGLVGFSYGARIITGALHILGGGDLSGLELGERQHPDRTPARVVLMAAALHSDWLADGHYHGQAMSQIDQMLLLNNSADPAMRYYRFSTTGGRPQALGLCGPTCHDERASHITSRNLAGYVGNRHDENLYQCAPGVASQAWQYLSFQDL